MAVGEILVRQGLCDADAVDAVVRSLSPADRHRPLIEVLVEREIVDGDAAARAIGDDLRLPAAGPLEAAPVPADLVSRVPIDFARRRLVLPIGVAAGGAASGVRVAMADPLDDAAVDDLALLLGGAVEIAVAPPAALRAAINRFYYEAAGADGETPSADAAEPAGGEAGSSDLLVRTGEGPVVDLVDRMLLRAVRARASDVHVEPYERELRIRFRVDGLLQEQPSPPHAMHAGIVSRIKIMADLDIAEQRLPQDGKARIRIGDRELDLRVSTVPTTHGERVVLRLLDPAAMLHSLEGLGMPPPILDGIARMITRPHGLLLVTGPTGSGKTTTLYGALQEIHDRRRNIMTIEEPVEYQMQGVAQIEVRPGIGLTFAQGLRHVLRQDPDVILIGEMRDLETAEIAVRASLTGHQVLSTLHTNDAASAVTRLLDMGVESYLVSACLLGVVAQRLVRRICPDCAEPDPDAAAMTGALGMSAEAVADLSPRRGRGCAACAQSGFRDRIGVFEMIPFDREVRRLVHDGGGEDDLRSLLAQRGLPGLRDDGIAKVRAGVTTLAEVVRVTMRDQD